MSKEIPMLVREPFWKRKDTFFFGRDREARDLLSLVASEQLVLFYVQSGAGKSSLINTRLILGLEGKKFEVFRVGRVGGDWPPGIELQNIYDFNLMRSLVQQEINPDILDRLSLSKFLAGLNANESGYFYSDTPPETRENPHQALIIDQFEELFSTHAESWKQREDYIDVLDPYAHLLPARLLPEKR